MLIAYSGKSAASAQAIAACDNDSTIRSSQQRSDVNWGRAWANSSLNPDIHNSTNKRIMRRRFREHGVPTPKLLDVNSEETISYPMVGRPDNHMKGRGFWLCRNERDVLKALRGTKKKRAATHFMEYIDNVAHEYRVHIFKGKSIRISEKQFLGWHDYTTIKPSGEVGKVRQAAKQAVEAVGLDFGAVDVIVDNEGQVYVLEVNAAPGLGGTMPKLYSEVFNKWKDGLWQEQ